MHKSVRRDCGHGLCLSSMYYGTATCPSCPNAPRRYTSDGAKDCVQMRVYFTHLRGGASSLRSVQCSSSRVFYATCRTSEPAYHRYCTCTRCKQHYHQPHRCSRSSVNALLMLLACGTSELQVSYFPQASSMTVQSTLQCGHKCSCRSGRLHAHAGARIPGSASRAGSIRGRSMACLDHRDDAP